MPSALGVDNLSTLVLKAIGDEAAWRPVLETVMAATGARVGVMTLRNPDDAALNFPADASISLAAPLIVGIAANHVASYFERYAALDPWTVIENEHHPHSPYFMSERLPLLDLEATEFYAGWLRPQCLCECLVAEVHCSSRHWVALNLLFDQSAFGRQQAILRQVEALLPILKMGWGVRERLADLSLRETVGSGFLETVIAPCLVLDDDLVVVAANSLALRDFAQHAPLAAQISIQAPLTLQPCSLADCLHGIQGTVSGSDQVVKIASLAPNHQLHVSRIALAEDVVGRWRSQILILAKADTKPVTAPSSAARIWDNPRLTTAQSEVVRWIAEGGVIPDFALAKGIAKKTAYDHLLAARQKLEGISSRDIYTSHQAQLAMER